MPVQGGVSAARTAARAGIRGNLARSWGSRASMGLPGSGLPASGFELPIRRPVSPISRPDRLSGAPFAPCRVRIVYPAPGLPYFALGSSIRRSDRLYFSRIPLSWRPAAYVWSQALYSGAGYSIFSRLSLCLPQSSLYLARSCLFLPRSTFGSGWSP